MTFNKPAANEFWSYAQAYEKTAIGGRGKPQKFTPEILYNVCAMAIENYCMGFLCERENLPENHTLRDLVRACEKIVEVPRDLKLSLHKMDQFQEICVIEFYQRRIPSEDDVLTFLALVESTRTWLESLLNSPIETF